MKTPRVSPLFVLYVVMLMTEAVVLAGVTVLLIVELLTATADSFASAVALTVIAGLTATWLIVISVNTVRGFAWTRSASIVWQVLQIAVAIGALQGAFAVPGIGFVLLAQALTALVLLFSRPVRAATSHRPDTR